MARQLNEEAEKAITTDQNGLYTDVARILDVAPISLPKVVSRTPDRLAHYDVVIAVSKALNKSPDDILEEAKVAEGAS